MDKEPALEEMIVRGILYRKIWAFAIANQITSPYRKKEQNMTRNSIPNINSRQRDAAIPQLSLAVRAILGFIVFISASGAIWIALDLYSGIHDGVFHLTRNTPIESTNHPAFSLIFIGELLATMTLLGISAIFLFIIVKSSGKQADHPEEQA